MQIGIAANSDEPRLQKYVIVLLQNARYEAADCGKDELDPDDEYLNFVVPPSVTHSK